MKISLFINKPIEQNAEYYFELAKKNKKKLAGAKKAVEISEKKFAESEKEELQNQEKHKELKEKILRKPVKREWYEKFRWFISSDGFLVIGGRDATTNEIIIKKYAEKDDVVLHTEQGGSPFVIIKTKNFNVPETTLNEAAAFAASTSRAWTLKMGGADVFYVRPEQVTKTAKAGEYVAKGSFVISGKTPHLHPAMDFAVGKYEEKVMGGPLSAVKKHCTKIVEIIQGDEKPSDVAKRLKNYLDAPLDEIIRVLPPGECKIKEMKG